MESQDVVACPHCHWQYKLTAEFLAQYGGRDTVCEQCGELFSLPHSLDELRPRDHRAAQSDPGSAPVLDYSPGRPRSTLTRCWREGEELVMELAATLPRHCIACGRPASEPSVRVSVSWYERSVIPQGLIGLMLLLTSSRRALVRVPMCSVHKGMRLGFAILALLSFVVAVGMVLVAATSVRLGFLGPFATIPALGSILFLFLRGWGVPKAGYIDHRIVRFVNVDQRFLKHVGAKPVMPVARESMLDHLQA